MLGWELPPHNSGGLGVACYQLCKSLANRGANIDFVLPYTADHEIDFMNIVSAHPQDVEAVRKVGTAYDSFKYVKETGEIEWVDMMGQSAIYEEAVGRIAKLKTYNVIHAHDWMTFRAALRAKEQTGLPLIVHVHSVESDRAGGKYGNPFVHDIEYNAMMLADRVIAISNHSKHVIMRDYGIPANKIEVAHNSIEVSDMQPLDPHNAYAYLTEMKQHGYKVVVNVGRHTIMKGLPNLLRAAKEVIAREPKTLFLLVGSGEQELELLLLAAELGISKNIIFTGFQRGKNWRDAYAIGDLFVMPSVSEPFGLVALEAIGYGIPVLISKQSGVSEVVKNCLRADFWDTDEMANQMVSALRYGSLRDELHKNAFSEYQSLSWTSTADKLLGIYQHHVQAAMA